MEGSQQPKGRARGLSFTKKAEKDVELERLKKVIFSELYLFSNLFSLF